MGLNCYIYQHIVLHENFINTLVNSHAHKSDVMCHDSFIGSQEFHGSCIHFRVHVRVHIVSHDMIECGMMWKRILLCSYGTYICMELTFALESWIHPKNPV